MSLTVRNETVGRHPGVTASLVRVRVVLGAVNGHQETTIREIRDLPPGGSVEVRQYTVPYSSALHYPEGANGPTLIPMRLYAEIIETVPVEPPGFQHNNATEGWLMAKGSGGFYTGDYTNGDMGVSVEGISDRFPSAGGATTFTVRAFNDVRAPPGVLCGSTSVRNPDGASCSHTQFDVQVKISLSPGLSFARESVGPVRHDV